MIYALFNGNALTSRPALIKVLPSLAPSIPNFISNPPGYKDFKFLKHSSVHLAYREVTTGYGSALLKVLRDTE